MPLLYTKHSSHPELVRSVSYPQRAHGLIVPTRTAVKRPHNRANVVLLAIFAFGMIGFFTLYPTSTNDVRNNASPKQAQAAPAPVPEPIKKLDFTAMGSDINAVIAAHPLLDIGVATVDIKTGDSNSFGVENPFVAASTAKLLTAIAFLHDVEQGSEAIDQQVGARSATEALEAMIVESDNQAWNDFNNGVMSHEELDAYAEQIGLGNYSSDKNTITAVSLAQLLSKLYDNKLLNKDHTKQLLSYMERAKEVEYITSIAPAGTKVYHKPGYLSDRIHDAAIIDNGNRPYVLVIFTKSRTSTYDMQAGADVFHAIAKSTFNTFLTSN